LVVAARRYVPAHIMTNLANLHVKRGRLPEAEVLYERALKVIPSHAQAGCNLAIVLLHQVV
jgi:Flp pilus assembly protein TadD